MSSTTLSGPANLSARLDRSGKPSVFIPIVICGVGVAAIIALFFAISGDAPEAATDPEAGLIATDPTGAGLNPDGAADRIEGGIPTDGDTATEPAARVDAAAAEPGLTTSEALDTDASGAMASDGGPLPQETVGSEDNEVVTDPDRTGSAFVPTESGPEGSDNDATTTD